MTLRFEIRCHASKWRTVVMRISLILLFLRNHIEGPYRIIRRLHHATDVEGLLPAGAKSQARHPRDTPVAVTPI